MQNSGRTKFKRTSIDRLMNTLVLWVRGTRHLLLGLGREGRGLQAGTPRLLLLGALPSCLSFPLSSTRL